MPSIDSLIYLDADTLFLASVEHVWSQFYHMNSTQMIGIAPELDHPKYGWFAKSAKTPIYGKSGVNSGVLLMNLTRMRQFDWQNKLMPVYLKYGKLLYADQGIINVILHFNTGKNFYQ